MTIARLRKAINRLHPVSDASTRWLDHLTPSQAFLVCIGSGPWKYERRFKVQAKALARLGSDDLTELRVTTSLFPLTWQLTMTRNMIRYCKQHGVTFDELISRSGTRNRKDSAEHVHAGILPRHKDPTKTPRVKVIGMFVRDYLKLECFPVDRHVRRWLIDNKLPTREADVVDLFREINESSRAYARAVFGEKSKNPVHKVTSNKH